MSAQVRTHVKSMKGLVGKVGGGSVSGFVF